MIKSVLFYSQNQTKNAIIIQGWLVGLVIAHFLLKGNFYWSIGAVISVTPEVSLVSGRRNDEMLQYGVTLNKFLNNW